MLLPPGKCKSYYIVMHTWCIISRTFKAARERQKRSYNKHDKGKQLSKESHAHMPVTVYTLIRYILGDSYLNVIE